MQRCTSKQECYGNDTPLQIDRKTTFPAPDYMISLINGAYIGVNQALGGAVFYVDLNGISKLNLSGRDIFFFYLVNVDTLGTNEGCQYVLDTVVKNLKSGIYPGGYASCYVPHGIYNRTELLGTSIHRSCNRNAVRLLLLLAMPVLLL